MPGVGADMMNLWPFSKHNMPPPPLRVAVHFTHLCNHSNWGNCPRSARWHQRWRRTAKRMQSPDVLCCLQTGPCVTAAGLENVNRTQCLVTRRELFEACQTASPCPFVWVVFPRCFGGDGVLACGLRSGDIYPRPRSETISDFYGSYVIFSSLASRWGAGRRTPLVGLPGSV